MQDRIKKFNKDFYNKVSDESGNKILISAREKNMLKLRKDKIEEEIMKKRMNSYIRNFHFKSNNEKFNHLVIPLDELLPYLPDYFDPEFNSYDDKYGKIKEILKDYLSNISSGMNVAREAYLRYSLVKLRDLSMVWESINDEGVDIDPELVEKLIQVLKMTDDVRLHYEISHILINLTYESKEFTNYLIEEEFLQCLFKLISCKEAGVVDHSLWIFSNLFEDDEQTNLILTCLPELPDKINSIVKEYSNIFEHTELLKNVTWLMYRILRHDGEVADRFKPSIGFLLNFLENEVSNIILIKEMRENAIKSGNKLFYNLFI